MRSTILNQRTYLKPGTRVSLSCGGTYEITGEPIGSGGGSIIYPVEKIYVNNGEVLRDGIKYVLKECYPLSLEHTFIRNERGEIIPAEDNPAEWYYLKRIREMQLAEKEITQSIYLTGSRLLPILESGRSAIIQMAGQAGDFSGDPENQYEVENTYTVMESLSAKGRSLHSYVEEYGALTPIQAFHVVEQLLFSLREIHRAGFLHLDIQDGNIFLKGTLEDESDIVTLIDFGSARELVQGKTVVIADRVIFTTQGFSAPEILLHNDGTLRLGPEADLYSVGCLILYLLTGNRFDANYLIHNTSGKYLTNFKLRKIACPKHLVDKMQEIIARALAVDLQNRYSSADEMLEDVSDFVKALRPYRSDLAAVTYDAFICYKHGPIDSEAARILQNKLEHFRAPRKVSERRYPFKRIFVDEGELSSCADFGEQVCAALKNSGWLIVICSPDTPLSPWVKLEIDTFLKFHDRSRILAVLTGGEPETSFPEQLLGTKEVLAADARGADRKEIVKRLKGDTLLKIAAPMLGITFDSLKQRRRAYRYKQIAGVATLLTAIALAFSGYAYRQARIIANQADALLEEYTRTLISQSEYYVKEAQELIESNNIVGAVEKLLLALPDDTTDRPVLSGAVYTLTSVLNIYKADYSVENTFTPVNYLSFTDDMENTFFLDKEGKYLFTSDGYSVWVRDTDTFKSVQTICAHENSHIWNFEDAFFVKENGQIIFCENEESIYCVDYLTGEEIWSVTEILNEAGTEHGISLVLSEDETLLAAVVSGAVIVLDTDTGEVLDSFGYPVQGEPNIKEYLNQDEYQSPEMGNEIVISPDNRYLVFTTDQWENQDGYYYYPNYVYIADLRKRKVMALEESIDHVREMLIDEDQLFIMGSSVEGTAVTRNGTYTVSNEYVGEAAIYSYNLLTGKQEWRSAVEYCGTSEYNSLSVVDSPYENIKGKIVVAAFYDEIITLFGENGQIIQDVRYSDPIIALFLFEKGIYAVHSNGLFSRHVYNISTVKSGKDVISYKTAFTDNILRVKCDGSFFYVLKESASFIPDPEGLIKYEMDKADAGYQTLLEYTDRSSTVGAYHTAGDGWGYKISGSMLYLTDCIRAASYEFELPVNNETVFGEYDVLGASETGSEVYLCYKDSWKGLFDLYSLNVETGNWKMLSLPIGENAVVEECIFFDGILYYVAKEGTITNYADQISEEGKEKASDSTIYDVISYNRLKIYAWTPQEKESSLLCEITLEESDDGVKQFASEDWTEYYGMSQVVQPIEKYIANSFTVSSDGKFLSLAIKKSGSLKEDEGEESTRLVLVDTFGQKSKNVTPDFLENVGLTAVAANAVNDEGNICAVGYNDSTEGSGTVILSDSNGKTIFTETKPGKVIEKLFFSREDSLLWMLYEDIGKYGEYELAAYDMETGAACEAIALSDYASYLYFFDCSVQWINNTAFLLYDGTEGFIIDESCVSPGVSAVIEGCIGYNENEQKIYVVHEDYSSEVIEWGSFAYVSLEELIQRGQEMLY